MKPLNRNVYILLLLLLSTIVALPESHAQTNEMYLLVVDVQTQFIKDIEADSSSAGLLKSINVLIEHCDPHKVVYIKSPKMALTISFKRLGVDTLSVPELDKRLKIVNANIFLKTKGNAFISKDLNDFLGGNGAKKILVVGLAAERCVYETVLGGLKLGYEMYLMPEAILGVNPEGKDKSMEKLVKKGAKLTTLKEIRD